MYFFYFRGILLQEQKRYQEAIESYLMAIKCRPRLTSRFSLIKNISYLGLLEKGMMVRVKKEIKITDIISQNY